MKTPAIVTQVLEKGKNDPYIDGNFEVHKTSDASQILYARSKIYDSEKVAQSLSSELQALSKNAYPNVLPVIDFEVKSERRICSTHYLARAYIPYLTEKLSDLIYNRLQSNQYLSKQELVYLLYQSISGLAFLHSLGIYHQNLSSVCIRHSQTGFCLHYDPLNEKSGFYPNGITSPERKQNPSNYDKNKDDVYALGIILLQAGTLQQNLSASPEQELLKLQSLMADNQLFYSTVREMIVPDPERRMDSLALVSGLPPFESIKSYFTSTGSDQRFINSEVPRFWMKTAESERSSYFAPMKQSDGPGRMYSRNSLQPSTQQTTMIPQSISQQPISNPSRFTTADIHPDHNPTPIPVVPTYQTQQPWNQGPNSMIQPQYSVGNVSPNRMANVQMIKSQPTAAATEPYDAKISGVSDNHVRESLMIDEGRLSQGILLDNHEVRTSMIPQNKLAIKKSVDDHQTSIMRKTARASALAFAPNLQKLPEEIVRAENMRTIPEGQTKMIRVDPVPNLDRNNILNLLQEIADGPTDFDSEVEKYSESLKGQDKYFVTPQGQVFRKEETTYRTHDPVDGEKYIIKVQYMPDSIQTKQLNRFRYENKELTPYYMPAWPKYSLSPNTSVSAEEYYHLEPDTLNLQTQEGTVYVDQHGNQFLSVPVE